jgi:hypothetical protein
VPVLSITHTSIHQVQTQPLEVLSSVAIEQMTKPLIFSNAKKLFSNMKGGSDAFFAKVKKDAAEKKQAIGRVTEALGSEMLAKITDIVKRTFVNDAAGTPCEIIKGQMVVGPCFPAEWQDAENQPPANLVTVMTPAWWATGPHHETTNLEPHKLGSIRILFSGSRSFACVKACEWIHFCRQSVASTNGQQGKGKGKGKSMPAFSSGDPVSLGSMSSNMSYQDAKLRFRNLSEVTWFNVGVTHLLKLI